MVGHKVIWEHFLPLLNYVNAMLIANSKHNWKHNRNSNLFKGIAQNMDGLIIRCNY